MRTSPRVPTAIVLGVGLTLLALGVAGLVVYSHAHDNSGSKVGVLLDDQNRPVLVAVQCPGHRIGRASIRLKDSSEVVWRAEHISGRASNELPLIGEIPGYLVTGQIATPDTWFEVGQVKDDAEVGVGTAEIEFRLSDLRRDEVLDGVTGARAGLSYVSVAEFSSAPPRC
jgi:hypothetical protein